MLGPNVGHHKPVFGERPYPDGISLDDLAEGSVVEIETQHHHYRLVKEANSQVRISGHPTFCPEPVEVKIEGSIENGQPLNANPRYIGRGMRLLLRHPQYDLIATSRIRDVHRA
jgi:hypothetical protein